MTRDDIIKIAREVKFNSPAILYTFSSLSTGKPLPDYLMDRLQNALDVLGNKVLR